MVRRESYLKRHCTCYSSRNNPSSNQTIITSCSSGIKIIVLQFFSCYIVPFFMDYDNILFLSYEFKLQMSTLFFCFELYLLLTTPIFKSIGETTIHASPYGRVTLLPLLRKPTVQSECQSFPTLIPFLPLQGLHVPLASLLCLVCGVERWEGIVERSHGSVGRGSPPGLSMLLINTVNLVQYISSLSCLVKYSTAQAPGGGQKQEK